MSYWIRVLSATGFRHWWISQDWICFRNSKNCKWVLRPNAAPVFCSCSAVPEWQQTPAGWQHWLQVGDLWGWRGGITRKHSPTWAPFKSCCPLKSSQPRWYVCVFALSFNLSDKFSTKSCLNLPFSFILQPASASATNVGSKSPSMKAGAQPRASSGGGGGVVKRWILHLTTYFTKSRT